MKKWVFGAALAGFGGLTLLYLLSEERQQVSMPLTRTVMFSILKELRRELVGPLISLANLAKSIKSELSNATKAEMKAIVEANCNKNSANILSQIRSIEERVYSRYNTCKSAVRNAYESEFANDKELQVLIMEIKTAVDQAYDGRIPSLENPLPSFVNHDFVLNIMRDICMVTVKIAYEKVQEYKNKGFVVDQRNKEFLDVEIEIENAVESVKQELFKKYGLLYLEDSPSMIVHSASKKFSVESLSFAKRLRELEESCRESVELIMKDHMSYSRYLELTSNINNFD